MGGITSGGRYHYNTKSTTNEYRSIDIRRFHRDGLLRPGQSFVWNWSINNIVNSSIKMSVEENEVTLTYQHQSSNNVFLDKHYTVKLNWTSCNYGNKRPWFICPAKGCGRRIAILYGGSVFACRQCYRLAYPSQREDLYGRAARKANIIRNKLGWELGILNGKDSKPKGMHWSTYEKLTSEHDIYVTKALSQFRMYNK